MAVPKDKERITITIHKETKKLLDEIISLHDSKYSYSNIVEIALLFYGKACLAQIEQVDKAKEKN